MSEVSPAWVHPTANVEEGVELGPETKVWDGVHIRRGARVGRSCIVGEKTYIAYDCTIGDFCKLNAAVYVCAGVRLADFCMIAAHVVFTNDMFPRAGNVDLTGLETSDPTAETLSTSVERGVTIGANATIGPGITLGRFAMIGMGSVVTRDVEPHRLVVGNPARPAGWVCTCGSRLDIDDAAVAIAQKRVDGSSLQCARCERVLVFEADGRLTERARSATS